MNSKHKAWVRREAIYGALTLVVLTIGARALGISNGTFSDFGFVPDVIGNACLGALAMGFIACLNVRSWGHLPNHKANR